MKLFGYVGGIGVLGPGLNDWPQTAAVLSGQQPYVAAPTVLPVPAMLPPAERRRTGRVVKVALAVALEATSNAGANPERMPSVFSSSGSDGHICHEICQALALTAREVSPTRFSNSVHNVAAGYWSIATGSMSESNVLCAFDASFVLPEGGPSVDVKVKSWRGAELWKMKDENISREDFEQKVYDLMFDGAFDQLDKKIQDTFF